MISLFISKFKGLLLTLPFFVFISMCSPLASATSQEQNLKQISSEKRINVTDQERIKKAMQADDGGNATNTIMTDQINCNGNPSSKFGGINKYNKDGVFFARDEISFYSGMISTLAWFLSVMAVVLGGIVGVNVFQGKSILDDARKELSELRVEKSKTQEANSKYEEGIKNLSGIADKIFVETINKIKSESLSLLEDLVKKEYGVSTAARYKDELLIELEKEKPDDQYVYIRLTDIINYPDANSFKIFSICTTKLFHNRDVMHIVSKGLQVAAEKTNSVRPV